MAERTRNSIETSAARQLLATAAREAGRLALSHFRPGERTRARIQYKSGGSPVTEADLAVDAFLKRDLMNAFPGAGWLSEETEDDASRLAHSPVLIIDPIDGTRAFIDGDPRWAVSIALVEAGRPIAGVVHAPALDETYTAAARGGASLNGRAIAVSARETLDGARIGGPRALTQSIERGAGLSFALEPKIPSLAYRVALVASGAIDLGLASDKAHDWDIAAVDLILSEAGGALVDARGKALKYNQEETRHSVLFAASRRLIEPFVAAAALAGVGQDRALAPGA